MTLNETADLSPMTRNQARVEQIRQENYHNKYCDYCRAHVIECAELEGSEHPQECDAKLHCPDLPLRQERMKALPPHVSTLDP